MIYGIGPYECDKVSAFEDAKATWDTLHTAYERTSQVKKAKIDNLNCQYDLFRMFNGESI